MARFFYIVFYLTSSQLELRSGPQWPALFSVEDTNLGEGQVCVRAGNKHRLYILKEIASQTVLRSSDIKNRVFLCFRR
jgi:hypothetical protein